MQWRWCLCFYLPGRAENIFYSFCISSACSTLCAVHIQGLSEEGWMNGRLDERNKGGLTFTIKATYLSTGWVAKFLECCPMHQKFAGLISWSGHIPMLQVPSPMEAHMGGSQSMLPSLIDVSLSLSLPFSLSSINKHILGWGLKKKINVPDLRLSNQTLLRTQPLRYQN